MDLANLIKALQTLQSLGISLPIANLVGVVGVQKPNHVVIDLSVWGNGDKINAANEGKRL